MRDNDIIYVDNADQVEIAKFLGMIATVTSGAAVTTGDAANTKSSLLYLFNQCAHSAGNFACQ